MSKRVGDLQRSATKVIRHRELGRADVDCANHAKAVMNEPTPQAYQELQDAYRFLNERLFSDRLPNCLITLQRRARTYGYFCFRRFENRSGNRTDEIALNPVYFAAHTESGILSTLVHEMVHLQQYHFGTPSRRGYHNREFAELLIAVGLYPSATGEPGGRETGDRVSHYIVEDGPFQKVCSEFLDSGFRFSWLDSSRISDEGPPRTSKAQPGQTDRSNRWKYTCPTCRLNAWARPSVVLVCGTCHLPMLSVSEDS
jgi:predicted SprT family Zn-dependent metalloprotease